jgi:DNA-binding NtrC family response regulator
MTAADELEQAGFQVLEATNADVALKLLEARSGEVQVLFTDVDMPGSMDGMELSEQVHRRWPHVLLLISSGYARPILTRSRIMGSSCRSPMAQPPWSGTSMT